MYGWTLLSFPTNLQRNLYCHSPALSAVADEQIGIAHIDRWTDKSQHWYFAISDTQIGGFATLADTC